MKIQNETKILTLLKWKIKKIKMENTGIDPVTSPMQREFSRAVHDVSIWYCVLKICWHSGCESLSKPSSRAVSHSAISIQLNDDFWGTQSNTSSLERYCCKIHIIIIIIIITVRSHSSATPWKWRRSSWNQIFVDIIVKFE